MVTMQLPSTVVLVTIEMLQGKKTKTKQGIFNAKYRIITLNRCQQCWRRKRQWATQRICLEGPVLIIDPASTRLQRFALYLHHGDHRSRENKLTGGGLATFPCTVCVPPSVWVMWRFAGVSAHLVNKQSVPRLVQLSPISPWGQRTPELCLSSCRFPPVFGNVAYLLYVNLSTRPTSTRILQLQITYHIERRKDIGAGGLASVDLLKFTMPRFFSSSRRAERDESDLRGFGIHL